ncbi:hypothetical protein ACRHK7_01665 [Weissella tructae]|uniref:Lipoprotein n=2 Tax=Weissella TaxID=46255 RepID=A0A075TWD5_9LACO|nr:MULTISPECIES: hypothetical protein [Weissella]AIG65879.1 hypothetical protein WS08_0940 [Weissella tructae]AIM63258.1 hypothetical protein WS74_1006 [Weissella ceti]AIM64592.1 hypothetical protein WS105_1002 [Weissella ceti]ELA07250.1 hypothetical protein WCNC_02297 [Weissella ceti NC36]QVV91038.1 hypothetical protein KHQ32_05275 [Weissella tructae]
MKKILTIIGALLVLILGAGGVYAVMNNNTDKQYNEAITMAEKHVKEHEWKDAQTAYKDAAKIKKSDMTTAADEQLVAVMNAEKIAGHDQKGALDILKGALKLEVTVPVIDKEIKAMQVDLQKQLDDAKKKAEQNKDGSRSDITSEKSSSEAINEANSNQNDNTNNPQGEVTEPSESNKTESNNAVDADKKAANIAEGKMTVSEARARLAEQGINIDYVPDTEVQNLIQTVNASNGTKSLADVANSMKW